MYDRDGRARVQVWYGRRLERSFNEAMLERGYAQVDRDHLPEDLAYFLELEAGAREQGFGIWRARDP